MLGIRIRPWSGRRAESVSDYPGVLIPLEEAHQHSHSYRTAQAGLDDESIDGGVFDDDDDVIPGGVKQVRDHEGTGMLEMNTGEYSVEGLRKYVQKGNKGEKPSVYESKQHPTSTTFINGLRVVPLTRCRN